MDGSDKASLRAGVREALRAIAGEERRELSQRLCAHLLEQPVWRDAASVLLFAPLPDEPDISALLEEGWRAGKTVALPRYEKDSDTYRAWAVRERAQLIPGRFGVLEPGADCPALPLNHLDLVLVPAVAFDFGGRRLGRGKGFYDRLLAEVRGHKCGVAYELQLVAAVPEEPHDVRVDSILTPRRWQLCPRPA